MLRTKRSFFSDLTAFMSSSFDIITAYEVLDQKRQETLRDQALHAGPATYRNMVKLYWPQATAGDAKVLERFLRNQQALKAAA